jgi:hypothetical protein
LSDEQIYCSSCGSSNKRKNNYCTECGQILLSESIPTKTAILKEFFEGVERQNWEAVDNLLADTFIHMNPDEKDYNKDTYMEYLSKNAEAFRKTGFRYNASNFHEEGNTCSCSVYFANQHLTYIATFKESKISKLEWKKGIVKTPREGMVFVRDDIQKPDGALFDNNKVLFLVKRKLRFTYLKIFIVLLFLLTLVEALAFSQSLMMEWYIQIIVFLFINLLTPMVFLLIIISFIPFFVFELGKIIITDPNGIKIGKLTSNIRGSTWTFHNEIEQSTIKIKLGRGQGRIKTEENEYEYTSILKNNSKEFQVEDLNSGNRFILKIPNILENPYDLQVEGKIDSIVMLVFTSAVIKKFYVKKIVYTGVEVEWGGGP